MNDLEEAKTRDDIRDGGTEELVVRIRVFSSEDAFGNERATGEHSGQKIEFTKQDEDDLAELLISI